MNRNLINKFRDEMSSSDKVVKIGAELQPAATYLTTPGASRGGTRVQREMSGDNSTLQTIEPLEGTGSALISKTKKQQQVSQTQQQPLLKPDASDSITNDGKKTKEVEVEEPPNKESMCILDQSEIIVPKLVLLDIKNPRLQNIYNCDMEELRKNVMTSRKILEPKSFKFEVLVCFWLTLHLKQLEFAQFMLDQDPLLEKILSNMRKTGKQMLADEKAKPMEENDQEEQKIMKQFEEEQNSNKGKGGLIGKLFSKKPTNEGLDSEVRRRSSMRLKDVSGELQDLKNQTNATMLTQNDESAVISQKQKRLLRKQAEIKAAQIAKFKEDFIAELEGRTGIRDEEDLDDVLFLLKSEAGQTFNTNIMRIALNMQEEKIASLIIALYQAKVDDEMVLRAVKTHQLGFLYTMFAYNKNYEELMSKRKFQKVMEAATLENDPEAIKAAQGARFKVFTLDYVIKKIIDYGEELGKDLVKGVAAWRLRTTENILKSMLKNNMDDVALDNVLTYIDFVDTELLAFCILNNNETFLKYCLKNGIYTTLVLSQPELIDEVLKIFRTGSKTELILNVLMYMNLMKWSRPQLKSLVDQLGMIVKENHEKNPITISYNPILVIALACEQILFIEDNFLSMRHECRIVRTRMLTLGDKILDSFDDEMLSKVFLDTDFKDRTLLKIITINKFEQLFSTYKVGVILEEIWVGKNTFDCDGEIKDFSLITHLVFSPIKRLKNQRLNFKDLLFAGFSYSTFKEQKFWFQYKFRSTSIAFIYQKDLISAVAMVIIFQLINFTYLNLFKERRFDNFNTLAKIAYAEDCLVEYQQINFLGTIFSSGLVFHLLEKLLFNIFAKKPLILDNWTILDFVSAALNLFCFNVIGNVTVDQVIDQSQKRVLDYYVICVTILTWLRFFGYFFMVRIISKLLHTLFRMLRDTVSFIFIVVCYFIVMTTIFTMLFQLPDKDRFGSVTMTIRTLFNALIGQYDYLDDKPRFSQSFSLLMMFHVFMSNIFLLNYLVAILSTVFALMTELGEFQYRSNKYQYIEKYSVPMLDPDGFKELVIHPPPLNFFTAPLVFGVVNKNCMRVLGSYFSQMMFWMENVPFIFAFLLYEIVLLPVAYFKQILGFIAKSTWKNFFFLVPFWIIFGPVIIVVLGLFGDMITFLRVLCEYHVKDEEEKQKAEDDYNKDKIILYNELMDVMRAIMHIYKKKEDEERGRRRKLLLNLQKKKAKDGSQAAADFLDQYFLAQDMDNKGYVLEKRLVKQAWAKYRPESALPSPKNGKPQDVKPKDRNDLNQVFGQVFIEKLLKGLKQRLYKGRRQHDFEELKRRHKLNLQQQKRGKQDDEYVIFRNDFNSMDIQMDEDPLRTRDIPQQELQLVDDFLNKFMFIAVGTTSKSQIDINLVLKALPARIDPLNLYRVDMIGFSTVQKALIAFQNDDQDELFNHYDDRTKQRLRKLNVNVTDTENQSDFLKDLSHKLLQLVNKMIKRTDSESAYASSHYGNSQRSRGSRSQRSARSQEGTSRFDNGDDDVRPGAASSNPYDDLPIQSQYAQQQRKILQKLGKIKQDGKSSYQDLGNLYMYLPQSIKTKDSATAILKRQTSQSKLEKQQALKPRYHLREPYYPKDYSDFKVNQEKNMHQRQSSLNGGGDGEERTSIRRRIYRPGGVNFKVDLHRDRSGGISKSPSKANLRMLKNNLQKAGVLQDLEFLDRKLSKQGSQSNFKENHYRDQRNQQYVSGGEQTPRDSIYMFSDQDDLHNSSADATNLSPTHHQKLRINMPPEESNDSLVQIEDQLKSNAFPSKLNMNDEINVIGEETIAPEDRLRDRPFEHPDKNGNNELQLTDEEDQRLGGVESKKKLKHKPPKVHWFKKQFNPVYD